MNFPYQKHGRIPLSFEIMKNGIKDLKNYCPVSSLSVVYKIFTKINANMINGQLEFNQSRHIAGFQSRYLKAYCIIKAINEITKECNHFLYNIKVSVLPSASLL